MKRINIIALCITILTIGQFNYCVPQLESPRQQAYRLTQESYISPEMQWAILSFLGFKHVTLNKTTGAVQGIESVEAMIGKIYNILQNSSINNATKESIKNALHAMLEATDIAIFVAAVEAAHHDPKYILYRDIDAQLSDILTQQKTAIQGALSALNGIQASDAQPSTFSSYFSWFETPAPMSMAKYIAPAPVKTNEATVTISQELMEAIIKKNNYKLEANPIDAANLLFKECFIAQQHHLKDFLGTHKITIKLHHEITPEHYIFTQFPNIEAICSIAQRIVPRHQIRTDLDALRTPEQITAHQLLLDIRQAIQTALYIANAKSSYNIGYILPPSVTSYLNSVVSQLLQYDAQLSTLCKEPQYGATQNDVYQDEQWAMITKFAAGTVVAATVAGGIYLYATPAAASYMAKGAAGLAYNVWNGNKNNNNPQGQPLTMSQQIWEYGKAAKNVTDTVGTVGSTIATAGGALAFGSNILQYADKNGYIPLDELDPNARHVVDVAQKVAAQAAVVGGAGMAVAGVGNSVANIGQSVEHVRGTLNTIGTEKTITGNLYNLGKAAYDLKAIPSSVVSATQSGKSAIGAGTAALGVVNQLAGVNNAGLSQSQHALATAPQQGQINQAPIQIQTPANVTPIQIQAPAKAPEQTQVNQAPIQTPTPVNGAPVQIPAPTITTVYTKFITDGVTQDGVNPLEKIATVSHDLLQKGQTTPEILVGVLQNLLQYIQRTGTATPEITQGLNQIKEQVASLANGSPQAAQ